MKDQKQEIPEKFWIPNSLWDKTQRLLPPQQPKPQGGRPRNNNRRMMEAIVYVLRAGVPRKALPRSIAAGSSAHDVSKSGITQEYFVGSGEQDFLNIRKQLVLTGSGKQWMQS